MLIRLSGEELAAFKKAAEAAGLSLSAWVRVKLSAGLLDGGGAVVEVAAVGEPKKSRKPRSKKAGAKPVAAVEPEPEAPPTKREPGKRPVTTESADDAVAKMWAARERALLAQRGGQ